MEIGGRYNWKGQEERLIYTGKNGPWHEFEKVDTPGIVWCEVLDCDLHMIEETIDESFELIEEAAALLLELKDTLAENGSRPEDPKKARLWDHACSTYERMYSRFARQI